MSRPQGHSAIRRILSQWKIPMTPAVIEPATFRFVAQHLNHCATADRSPHNTKCVLIFCINFSETFPVRSRNERDMIFSVKYRLVLSDCNETWIFWTVFFFFEKYTNIKFHENPSSGSRVVLYRRTDGRTDMTKLIIFVFRNFANSSKILRFVDCSSY